MDHSKVPVFKRPTKLPTREELAAIFNPPKQRKLSSDSTPRIIEQSRVSLDLPLLTQTHQTQHSTTSSTKFISPPHLLPPNAAINNPILNSVPQNIIPIVHLPAIVSDFFSDITTDLTNEKLSNQINGILGKFPPPIPPENPTTTTITTTTTSNPQQTNTSEDFTLERGGMMVPFIYPPPPIINPNELPYSLASFKEKLDNLYYEQQQQLQQSQIKPSRGRPQGKKKLKTPDSSMTIKTPLSDITYNNTNDNQVYVEAPPLPFPPPNYMPYPLSSEKSTLTPSEVFEVFLEANSQLPRVDMVVASAAGSLFDMKSLAYKEGFNILDYELGKLNGNNNNNNNNNNNMSGGNRGKLRQRTGLKGMDEEGTINDNETDDGQNREEQIIEEEEEREGEDEDSEEEEEEGEEGEEMGSEEGESEEEKQEIEQGEEIEDDETYFLKIDTKEYYDSYVTTNEDPTDTTTTTNKVEINMINPNFEKISSKLSNVKNKPTTIEQTDDKSLNEAIEDVYSYPEEAIGNLYRLDRNEFFPTNNNNNNKPNKEIAYISGLNHEKRRNELSKSIEVIEDFETRHLDDLFKVKKYHLLTRLKNLQSSKISFLNHTSSNMIKDDELLNIEQDLALERDLELLHLKLLENYELLKNSLNFYQNSHKIYNHLNYILINKLEKLKTFFEIQKNLFLEYIKKDDKDNDDDDDNGNSRNIFNINEKESNKLFIGISNHDYSNEIKDILKNLIVNDIQQSSNENNTPKNSDSNSNSNSNSIDSLELPELIKTPSSSNKLGGGGGGGGGGGERGGSLPPVLLHDFMPLITSQEFNLITGELNHKSLKNYVTTTNSTAASNPNHKKMLLNSIYEKMITSGSDTNLSDSGSNTTTTTTTTATSNIKGGKRRGGRRATTTTTSTNANTTTTTNPNDKSNNGISNGGGINGNVKENFDHKYSEATLLAKIMKQFSGPKMAKPDELNHDLELMGIKTKWPITK